MIATSPEIFIDLIDLPTLPDSAFEQDMSERPPFEDCIVQLETFADTRVISSHSRSRAGTAGTLL